MGLNIEDETRTRERPLSSIDEQVQKIKAVRRTCSTMDVPLVINARTDAFRFAEGDKRRKVGEVIERGLAYNAAGADCIYAFGVSGPDEIKEIVKKLDAPLNIRAGLGAPTLPELEGMGVARASVATGPLNATLGLLRKIARELLDKGTYGKLEGAITYDELNMLAVRRVSEQAQK